MPRPPFEFTDEIIADVERMASRGLTQEQIAYNLGIAPSTLYVHKKINQEFSEAIKRGKCSGINTIANKLFEKAEEGDNTAMIFYLKNRDPDNWEDVQKRQYTGKMDVSTRTITAKEAENINNALENDN